MVLSLVSVEFVEIILFNLIISLDLFKNFKIMKILFLKLDAFPRVSDIIFYLLNQIRILKLNINDAKISKNIFEIIKTK